MYDDWTTQLYAHKTFANTAKGHMALMLWVKKQTDEAITVRYIMEATGVYHESLAYFLDDQAQDLSIVLPNKISNYFKTLDVKTITDKSSSEAIAFFGLERKLESWKRPKAIFKKLKQLTRERDQIVEERATVKNQLHAEQTEAASNPSTITRFKQRIAFLTNRKNQLKKK